MLKSGTINITG